MSEINPYAAPESDVTKTAGNSRLADLEFNELKKLFYRSSNVRVIAVLISIAAVVLAITPFLVPEPPLHPFIYILLAIFYTVTVVGLFKRTYWGRGLGIVVSIISLINIPFGTIVGLFGLFAFIGSPRLFGEDRLTHQELKAEFNLQKANRKKR